MIRSQRIFELQQGQELNKWEALPEFGDLPGFSSVQENAPQQQKALEEVKDRVNKTKIQATRSFDLTSKASWGNFDDLKKISVRLPGGMPRISEEDRWMNDDVLGWHFLNGCNPNSIRRCKMLPKNFPVNEDMVKGFLDRGKSLISEMKVLPSNYCSFIFKNDKLMD